MVHLLKSRRSFLLEYYQNIHHRASVLFVGLDTYESLTLLSCIDDALSCISLLGQERLKERL